MTLLIIHIKSRFRRWQWKHLKHLENAYTCILYLVKKGVSACGPDSVHVYQVFLLKSMVICAQERAHFFKQDSKSENKVLPVSFQIMFESGFVLLFFAWAFLYPFCELFACFCPFKREMVLKCLKNQKKITRFNDTFQLHRASANVELSMFSHQEHKH